MEGRKILKLGHVSLSRPLLTYFLFFFVSTPRSQSARQIWGSWFQLFSRWRRSKNFKSTSRDHFTTRL